MNNLQDIKSFKENICEPLKKQLEEWKDSTDDQADYDKIKKLYKDFYDALNLRESSPDVIQDLSYDSVVIDLCDILEKIKSSCAERVASKHIKGMNELDARKFALDDTTPSDMGRAVYTQLETTHQESPP